MNLGDEGRVRESLAGGRSEVMVCRVFWRSGGVVHVCSRLM